MTKIEKKKEILDIESTSLEAATRTCDADKDANDDALCNDTIYCDAIVLNNNNNTETTNHSTNKNTDIYYTAINISTDTTKDHPATTTSTAKDATVVDGRKCYGIFKLVSNI
jgi:hypothetical protein